MQEVYAVQAIAPPSQQSKLSAYPANFPDRSLYAVHVLPYPHFLLRQAHAATNLGTSEESTLPRKIVAMRELRDEIRRRYL